MKLIAKNTISNGAKTYNRGDVFETDEHFTENLVQSGSADYVEPPVEDKIIEVPEDLTELNVKELKALCKELGIKGYSDKKEDELINMIEAEIA